MEGLERADGRVGVGIVFGISDGYRVAEARALGGGTTSFRE